LSANSTYKNQSLTNPIKKDSHLVILYGNLTPGGAVAKITGKEGLRYRHSQSK
jgi:dihydroxyacid dehydratase/phosphogluconate dehydratase